MAMKCCTKLETSKERCPIVFQGHPSNFKVTRYKTSPILTQIGRFRTIGRSQLSNPSDLPCCFTIRLLEWGCGPDWYWGDWAGSALHQAGPTGGGVPGAEDVTAGHGDTGEGTIQTRGGGMVMSRWHHGMEMIFALLALCEGNPSVTDGFPSQRASNAKLWCFLSCYYPEQSVEQTIQWPVEWDAMALIWHNCNVTSMETHLGRWTCRVWYDCVFQHENTGGGYQWLSARLRYLLCIKSYGICSGRFYKRFNRFWMIILSFTP